MLQLQHAALIAGIIAIGAAPVVAAGATSSTDATFANMAAMSGLAEVQAAHLAEHKASNAKVKQFAQQMVKDHTTANTELMQLAAQERLTLPTQPDSAQAAAVQQISQLSGAQFDQKYMQGQVADHKAAVTLFQQEASSGQDQPLKEYARKYLPVLQHHLQMAETISGGS